MEREKTDTKGRITDGVNEEWRRLGKKEAKKTFIYSGAEYAVSKMYTCQIKLALTSRQTVGQSLFRKSNMIHGLIMIS